MDNLRNHCHRVGEIDVSEENPAEAHKVECNDYAHRSQNGIGYAAVLVLASDGEPHFVKSQSHAVKQSPQHKVERRTVPQSAEQHGDDEVDVAAHAAFAVAAERYIQVVLEPRRQRDVPTAPEVGNRRSLIGAVEVDVKSKSQKQRQTYGHIAIAREVAVDLQSIAIYAHKVLKTRVKRWIVEDAFHEVDADIVGNHYLLDGSAHYIHHAGAEHRAGYE